MGRSTSYYPKWAELLIKYLAKAHPKKHGRYVWLASHLNVDKSTAYRWVVYGWRPDSAETVIRIAKALNIKEQWQCEELLEAAGYPASLMAQKNALNAKKSKEAKEAIKFVEEVLNRPILDAKAKDNLTSGEQQKQINGDTQVGNLPIFVDKYLPLRDDYINPREVFERTGRLPFTGRDWLLAEIDQFLEKKNRGYFILEANAGLGKTAFLAWLVQERGYVHHFCELAPGEDPEKICYGLESLAAQLALRYKLNPDGILAGTASRPDYLYNLLSEAAKQRNTNEKIVVVVDALDESGSLGRGNVMGLPTGLPEGVYFIVSQRPATVTLTIKDPTTTACQYCRFSAESDENQADMHRFLEYTVELPEIIYALQASEHKYTSEQFIATLIDKCRGVWIYLYFVVKEIIQGDRSPLDLAALPDGMTQYYVSYWRHWRDVDDNKWGEIYLPILAMLAATQEALSCEELIERSGAVTTERSLRRLLEEKWRPFLVINETYRETHYRFYHATLQEFFDGNLDQNSISLADRAMIKELSEETRMCHHRLSERYLKAWGGWERNLEELKDEALRDLDNRYGLRYLTAHLEASGRINDIHQLLRVEWVQFQEVGSDLQKDEGLYQVIRGVSVQNAWYKIRESVGQMDGYQMDIIRAWRLTDYEIRSRQNYIFSDIKGTKDQELFAKCIGLQCRYALIIASQHSRANNIGPGLLVELVKKKFWIPTQGIYYARQVISLDDKAEMLAALLPVLPAGERYIIVQEVISLIRSLINNNDYAYASSKLVSQLAKYLSLTQLQEMLSLVLLWNSHYQADTMASLAPYLSPAQVQEALSFVRPIQDSGEKRELLASLTPYLSSKQLSEVLLEINVVEEISERAEWLASLAPCLLPEQLQEVLSLVHSLLHNMSGGFALKKIIPYLSAEQIQEAFSLVHMMGPAFREFALEEIIPYLSTEQIQEALSLASLISHGYVRIRIITKIGFYHVPEQLQEALSLVKSLERDDTCSASLRFLSSYISSAHLEEALSIALSIDDSFYQLDALTSFAPYLSAQQLQEIILLYSSLERVRSYARPIGTIAPYLSSEQLQDMVSVAYSIHDFFHQIYTLANFASFLPSKQVQEIFLQRSFIKEYWAQMLVLASLAPYLSSEQIQEVFLFICSDEDKFYKERMIASLAPYFSSEQIQGILLTIYSNKYEIYRERMVASLAPYLSSEQIQEALIIGYSEKDGIYGGGIIASLVPYLSPEQIQEALSFSQTLESDYSKLDFLVSLAPHLSLEQRQGVLTQVLSQEGKYVDVYNLASLAPYLSSEQLQKVLTLTFTNMHNHAWAGILSSVAPYLLPEQLKEALSAACQMRSVHFRSNVLISLSSSLTKLSQAELFGLLQDTLISLSSRSRSDLLFDLAALSDIIGYLGGISSSLEVTQAIKDVGRWWP